MSENNEVSHQKLNLETSRIAWKDLQRFFANGTTIYVDADMDLVEVALQLEQDNAQLAQQWLQDGKIAKVADEMALKWFNEDAVVWAAVVKPWVLVQEQQVES